MGMAGTLRGSMTPRAAVVLWWCGRGASWGLPGRTRHFCYRTSSTVQVSDRWLGLLGKVRCKEDALRKKKSVLVSRERERCTVTTTLLIDAGLQTDY
jgi:hypothetical protein